ncbi:MAG: flagellum-specific ATP synthase FliI, partial [Gammaproteobacteria bacterium]
DDQQDPVADAARAILDGHIVLSRDLADAGHYPAIDIEASISRAMNDITDDRQQALVRRFKALYSTYQASRDLITVGAYRRGSDAQLDEAVDVHPRLVEFLQQGMNEKVPLEQSLQALNALFDNPPALVEPS